MPAAYDLLALYKEPAVNRLRDHSSVSQSLDPKSLAHAYHRLRDTAPRRHRRGKRYFVDHDGYPSGNAKSPRREEHLALALWNECRREAFPLPGGGRLKLLDYQFPLKARRDDRGIGKVDLLGVADDVRLCVIELKIDANGNALGDTPLRAFLEGLAYCAIVEANLDDIAAEAKARFGLTIERDHPALFVLAPDAYWNAFLNRASPAGWLKKLTELAANLEAYLGVHAEFAALSPCEFAMGSRDTRPALLGDCSIRPLDTHAPKPGRDEPQRGSPLRRWAERQVVAHLHAILDPRCFSETNSSCTKRPEDNLIAGLKAQDLWPDLADGAGNELKKFSAAYSSSALAVNAFGPFRHSPEKLTLLGYNGFTRAQFEKALPTGLRGTPPHLDFVAEGPERIVCVESKFLETLGHEPADFRDSYEQIVDTLAEPCWQRVYRELKQDPLRYRWLDAAQLVKHYLGLRKTFGTEHPGLSLLYVYWEPTNAQAFECYREHRRETTELSKSVADSAVQFVAMSYHELWMEWERSSSSSALERQLAALRERYAFELSEAGATADAAQSTAATASLTADAASSTADAANSDVNAAPSLRTAP